jgi:hypothetical protein
MKKIPFVLLWLSATWWIACTAPVPTEEVKEANPAAEGFNWADSDPRAIALADSVMVANGGRQAWDQTRYLRWNFFGRRQLTWDKWGNRVRIEVPADSTIYVVDLETLEGKVSIKGREMVDADTLGQLLARAKSIWINDSYWLVMPFKLKDSGVTLSYLRADTTQTGEPAEVVQLTFQEVGDTPNNKYEVYIAKATKRVVQWAFFQTYEQAEPNFITPWADYRKYGHLWLSGDRGQRHLTDIEVLEEVDDRVFTSLN